MIQTPSSRAHLYEGWAHRGVARNCHVVSGDCHIGSQMTTLERSDALALDTDQTVVQMEGRPSGKSKVRRKSLVAAGAVIPAGLYMLDVRHHSVNVPFTDDWPIAPLAFTSLGGHLT